MSTREMLKFDIDIIPEKALPAFQAMFTAFLSVALPENEEEETDPFYSKANQEELSRRIQNLNSEKPKCIINTIEQLHEIANGE
jgi:hypothetical protein